MHGVDHLSSLPIARQIKRLIAKHVGYGPLKAVSCVAPCSRQGLPINHVTMTDCGPLPHSFHPHTPEGAGIVSVALFPEVTLGCR